MEARFSVEFDKQLAERQRITEKIAQAISDGSIRPTALYEEQPTGISEDLSF